MFPFHMPREMFLMWYRRSQHRPTPGLLGVLLLLACAEGFAQTRAQVADRLGVRLQAVEQYTNARGGDGLELTAVRRADLPLLLDAAAHAPRAPRRESPTREQLGPEGKPALGAILLGAAQRKQMLLRQRPGHVAGLPVGPRDTAARRAVGRTRLDPGDWHWLGPGNLGGPTSALATFPSKPEKLLAGSLGGGLWLSRDAGVTWAPVDDFLPSLLVSCLAVDPTNDEVLYAGTGDPIDFYWGEGIFKSTDGGSTWERLASTGNNEEFASVSSLALSADGAVLIAGTTYGMFRSTDGGATFTKVASVPAHEVQFHPTDPRRVVAGGMRWVGRAFSSEDGGVNWSYCGGIEDGGRVSVTHAAADPRIVYAAAAAGGGRLYKSTDGGRNFTPVSGQTALMGVGGWLFNTVWAGDPRDPNLVLVGSTNLWKSNDGGKTFVEISSWWSPESAGEGFHSLTADPRYDGRENRVLYTTGGSGIYVNDDLETAGNNAGYPKTRGWRSLNGNYGATQVNDIAGLASGEWFATAESNGPVLLASGTEPTGWRFHFRIPCGRTEPLGGGLVTSWLVTGPVGQVFKFTDGNFQYLCGRYWDGEQWAWKGAPYEIGEAKENRGQWLPPVALDPTDPNRLWVGLMSLWRSDDLNAPLTNASGPRWRVVLPARTDAAQSIVGLAVSPENPEVMFASYSDGVVARTKNARADSPSWSRVGASSLPKRWCGALHIPTGEPQTVYAGFGNYVTGNVWKSTDGGMQWENVGENLPAVIVRCITTHPEKPAWVYVGTTHGLFCSEDGGLTWSTTNAGPCNVAVTSLKWVEGALAAATKGRGVFVIAPVEE